MALTYSVENDLGLQEFTDLLFSSGLAKRRPADQPEKLTKMLEHANLIICVRDDAGKLVGVARSLTDFSFCCYLSDLAVDKACQKQGIGRELIRRTRELAGGDGTTVLLLSAPDAMDYYPKVGMTRINNGFALHRPGYVAPDD